MLARLRLVHTNTMAALVKHGFYSRQLLQFSRKNVTCNYATKAQKKKGVDRKVGPRIYSSAESLAAKGFLRPQKEYQPPEDLTQKLDGILQNLIGTTSRSSQLKDINQRFKLFNACFKEFQHAIPNSLLPTMETVEDVVEFYKTPLSTITPYNNLKNMELPPNLHVQYDYHRFHPNTDTEFGGITAFPKSSTIVSGLRTKEKYKGHEQRESWPFSQ